MRCFFTPAILALALLTSPVAAQKDPHDHSKPGPNGGQVVEAGAWHAELVAKGEALFLYMSGREMAPLPPAGFEATAILVSDGKPLRITLAPKGDALAGTLPKGFKGRPKGAVRLVGPGGSTASAKFD